MRKLIALLAAIFLITTMLVAGVIAPANAQDDARITLLHAVPDVDVDVEIDGEIAISDFSFGDREDLSSLAGTTLGDLRVLQAGTSAVAIDQGDVDLPATGNFTAVVHLNEDAEAVLTVFENKTDAIRAGSGRLTVRHTAAVGEVDVLIDGDTAINGISNAKEASAVLPAADLEISLALDADGAVLVDPSTVSIIEGESIVIYAVGETGSVTVLTDKISLGAVEAAATATPAPTATPEAAASGTAEATATPGATATPEPTATATEDTALNSSPSGVETGNSPITSNTSSAVAFVAIGVIAICGVTIVGTRRSRV